MPFFINSLVDTVVGRFSEIKDYRKLFSSSHIGLSPLAESRDEIITPD